jgi:hypothetical protein
MITCHHSITVTIVAMSDDEEQDFQANRYAYSSRDHDAP